MSLVTPEISLLCLGTMLEKLLLGRQDSGMSLMRVSLRLHRGLRAYAFSFEDQRLSRRLIRWLYLVKNLTLRIGNDYSSCIKMHQSLAEDHVL